MSVGSYLDRPVKITVCADGAVSIMSRTHKRRLSAALPCYSTHTIGMAMALIAEVCKLQIFIHGGKTGTVIEPIAPNWTDTIVNEQDIGAIDELAEIFARADRKLFGEGLDCG